MAPTPGLASAHPMNLFIPEPTNYDLSFRLGGIPVRISAGFWAVHLTIAILFCAPGGIVWLLLWPACAFVSVLVHELGHVLAGRAYGSRGEIIFTPFGGLAGGADDLHKRLHRILVYAAGPAAQFLFAGLLWLVYRWSFEERLVDHIVDRLMAGQDPANLGHVVDMSLAFVALIGMNVGMPLFNLLPIPPLDGSKIIEEAVAWRRSGDRPPWEQDADWWKRG
jgi:Zn-dependent protease